MVHHPLFGANPVHETRVLKCLLDLRMVRSIEWLLTKPFKKDGTI